MARRATVALGISNIKMKKQNRQSLSFLRHLQLRGVVAIVSVVAVGTTVIPTVYATSVQELQKKIDSLSSQNDQKQKNVDNLAVKADTYEEKISQLRSQISSLQGQIDTNHAKQADLEAKIKAKQKELDQQKHVLGADLKAMYVDGQMSTVEMLATSKNLSDFVNSETYREAVQGKIQRTLATISKLQNQLKDQKTEVEDLLATLDAQQDQIASKKSQQDRLLAMNQAQQSQYNSQIKSNNKKISKLQAEQAAENARLFASSGSHLIPAGSAGADTYPAQWRNAPQDTLIDSWGMYNRECVSYTAWKVYASGHHMPYWGGVGNANQWDDNARAAGIPVNSNPRGSAVVAIKNSGPFGHAMWVEHVYGDGSILVSQYNASLNGTFSEAYISAGAISSYGLVFIHF